MTTLYLWWTDGEYPTLKVFRTEDFRVWWDADHQEYCLAYRSPLWSRLPVRRSKFLSTIAGWMGFSDFHTVKGTIKQ